MHDNNHPGPTSPSLPPHVVEALAKKIADRIRHRGQVPPQDIAKSILQWKVERLEMALRLLSALISENQREEFCRRYNRHKGLIPAPAGVIADEDPDEGSFN